jgi:flagellar FliL protein
MAKKDKAKKPEEPEAEKPAAEGEEGAAAPKKKMSGKTLVLFIVLPAVVVLGGGGAAAMMLLGGGKATEVADAAHGGEGEHKKEKPAKKPEKKDDHGASGGGEHAAAGDAGGEGADVGALTLGEEGQPSYYALPKMIVNLAGSGNQSQLLELLLTLEASDASAFDSVPTEMPRLRDAFQSFLRELRVEDINGSAGSYRLRIELLKRFNIVMAPAKADAVLIESFLVMQQ